MEKIRVDDLLKLDKEVLVNKIIVFPTDTVYGVGCLYKDNIGRDKIYNMKDRDYGKALPILVGDIESARKISKITPDMDKYISIWPGALTIIFESTDSDYPHDTIAIRIPDSDIAIKILKHFGPMEVTSVNISGEKELNSVREIEEKFKDKIDYLVTDEVTLSKTPSTIISLTPEFKVLRMGNIKF